MDSFQPGVTLRFDLPCEALGLSRPPMPLNVRFMQAASGDQRWTAVVVVAAGKASDAVSWMKSQVEGKAMVPPGLAPRTIRFEINALPLAWSRWLTAARIVQVDLGSHGVATLFVQGTPEELAILAGRLSSSPEAARQRISGTKPVESIAITPRQLEVLCNAVTMGYYDVPHRIALRELGKTMDLSVSAVSQLLRRAQGQIIRAFIDSNTLSRARVQTDASERNAEAGERDAEASGLKARVDAQTKEA